MIFATASIEIEKPAADVFRFVTDPKRAHLWHAGVTDFSVMPGMPAGSSGHMSMLLLGRHIESSFEVIENDADHRTVVRSNRGPLKYETTQLFAELETGRTIFTIHVKIDAGTVFRLAEPALQSMTKQYLDTDLATLKAVMESAV